MGRGAHYRHSVDSGQGLYRQGADQTATRIRIRIRSARQGPQRLHQHLRVQGHGVKLAEKFEGHRNKGHTWGRSWGGRRLRSSWLEALQRKMKERAEAMRASRVFKKFENQSHYISLCEYENAMYKDTLEHNNDG